MTAQKPVHVDDYVSLKNGKDSAHEQMLGVCRKALPGWEQLTVADIEASDAVEARVVALWGSRSLY